MKKYHAPDDAISEDIRAFENYVTGGEIRAVYLASDVDARIAELERLLDVERRAVAAAHGSAEIAVRWEAEAKKLGERVKVLEKALRSVQCLDQAGCCGIDCVNCKLKTGVL